MSVCWVGHWTAFGQSVQGFYFFLDVFCSVDCFLDVVVALEMGLGRKGLVEASTKVGVASRVVFAHVEQLDRGVSSGAVYQSDTMRYKAIYLCRCEILLYAETWT